VQVRGFSPHAETIQRSTGTAQPARSSTKDDPGKEKKSAGVAAGEHKSAGSEDDERAKEGSHVIAEEDISGRNGSLVRGTPGRGPSFFRACKELRQEGGGGKPLRRGEEGRVRAHEKKKGTGGIDARTLWKDRKERDSGRIRENGRDRGRGEKRWTRREKHSL